ncbi:transposase [Allochromatium palmeri]|uniref:Transposase IS701-like DDE domain-containing protein n=1 Tax=Allochromatium palmeri TaxID=231048 RepID=A0A6N8EJN3_9GAMM|nr:hypothetical protein [Allochromatium palmeri]
MDTTPNPRPFAATLADRGVVYQPNPAPGNKPIAVGHRSSVVAALPERSRLDPPWVVPLQAQRVASDTTATAVAAAQMAAVLADPAQPYGAALSVQVADSDYSHAAYLHTLSAFSNHVVIARSASNRVYYRPAPASALACGHPTWYGAPFRLADPETWGSPSQSAEWLDQTASGRVIRLTLERPVDARTRSLFLSKVQPSTHRSGQAKFPHPAPLAQVSFGFFIRSAFVRPPLGSRSHA